MPSRVSSEHKVADAITAAIGHRDFNMALFALRMTGKSNAIQDCFIRMIRAYIDALAMRWDEELYDKNDSYMINRLAAAKRIQNTLALFDEEE